MTIVDTGVPGYYSRDLPAELSAMGRTLDDVRAVVLTHAHSDHLGFAERIRRERSVSVRIHTADAQLARGEVKPLRDPAAPGIRAIRPGPLLGFLIYSARLGAMRTPPVLEVATFDDGATLDLPGAPRVVHLPGHTAGSAALVVVSSGCHLRRRRSGHSQRAERIDRAPARAVWSRPPSGVRLAGAPGRDRCPDSSSRPWPALDRRPCRSPREVARPRPALGAATSNATPGRLARRAGEAVHPGDRFSYSGSPL